MNPTPHDPAMLPRGRRRLLLLLPLSFAALWWATMVWGVPAVERRAVEAGSPFTSAFIGGTLPQARKEDAKGRAVFPLVVRCDVEVPVQDGKRSRWVVDRGFHVWLFRWEWSIRGGWQRLD